MKIDAESLENEKNRQRDILVAEIRASGYGATADVDQNQMSDYRDAMKEIKETEQYQEQTGLQREKEVNRMSIENQKGQLEREKIQAQKEIADKQLQIAQENKNKFDVKQSKEK
jgi:tRNA(Ser,Leu) C12 N-acetylase TAN1